MDDQRQFYAAYGGLGRVALMWGVPLIPFLLLVFLALLGMMTGFIFWGFLMGMALAAAPVLIIVGMKILCETDDRAVEVFHWKLKGLRIMLPNLLVGHPIIRVGVSIHRPSPHKKQQVYQFFKENRT